MATVVKVTEVFKTEATKNESARREFEALFDTVDATAIQALTADDGTTAIPVEGSGFPGYTAYTANRPIATRIGKSSLFRVIVPYSIKSTLYGGNQSEEPLSRPTEWSSDGIPSTLTVDRDASGNLIKNSSKQVLKVQIQHADKYIRAVKNYASLQNFDSYFNRTNSASYTIQGQAYGIETLWLSHVTQDFTEEDYDGEVEQYWRATFHFYAKIKRGTDEPNKSWRFKILDRGNVVVSGAGVQGEVIADDNGNIIVPETNLNGSGAVWDGTNVYYLNGATFATPAVTNDYTTMYQTADFNLLGL